MEPFDTAGVHPESENTEVGAELICGLFQSVSGLSWMTFFRYFPCFVFSLIVLSAYILGKRKGFGLEAALMTCFIPTAVGILGPAFLVPVALGLPFILLSIYVAFNFRSIWSYATLFLFVALLLIVHPPTAVGLVTLLVFYVLFEMKKNVRWGMGLAVALSFLFLLGLCKLGYQVFKREWQFGGEIGDYWVLPNIFTDYGYIPTALCLIGVIVLFGRGKREDYGLVFGFILLLLLLVIYFKFHIGMGIMYNRGLLYLMLVMGIFAGCGLAAIKQLSLPDTAVSGARGRFLRKNAGVFLCLGLIILALALAIPRS
ncbi:MAG: hypothetical protein GY852_12040, partial [bacterium]|nr:hypothetical protein [bacterium]